MNEKIEELTLLLMYLTSWNEEGLFYDENGNLDKGVIKAYGKDIHLMLLLN